MSSCVKESTKNDLFNNKTTNPQKLKLLPHLQDAAGKYICKTAYGALGTVFYGGDDLSVEVQLNIYGIISLSVSDSEVNIGTFFTLIIELLELIRFAAKLKKKSCLDRFNYAIR